MSKIVEVCLICDAVECGYRVVQLQSGLFAFVWGNIKAGLDDDITDVIAGWNTDEKGVSIHDSYEEAEQAYRECAEALMSDGREMAGREMLSRLGE